MQSSRLLTALKRTQALTPIAFRPAALAQQTTRAFAAHAKPTDAKHDAGHGAGGQHTRQTTERRGDSSSMWCMDWLAIGSESDALLFVPFSSAPRCCCCDSPANHDDHGHGAHHGVEFEGLTLTPPKRWHTVGAHFFGQWKAPPKRHPCPLGASDECRPH